MAGPSEEYWAAHGLESPQQGLGDAARWGIIWGWTSYEFTDVKLLFVNICDFDLHLQMTLNKRLSLRKGCLVTTEQYLPLVVFDSRHSSMIIISMLWLALVKTLLNSYWFRYHYCIYAFCVKCKKDHTSCSIIRVCRVVVDIVQSCGGGVWDNQPKANVK